MSALTRKTRGRAPRRSPRGVEVHMDTEKMLAVYKAAPATLAQATHTERILMAADLARSVLAGRTVDPAKVPYGQEALTEALRAPLTRYVQIGRQQVADELARQAKGRNLAEKRLPRSASARALTAASTSAEVSAAAIATRMQSAAAMASVSRRAASLTQPELEQTIMDAGDEAVLRVSCSVHDLVSLGRADEAATRQSDIANCVYSAILDSATCDECEAMDGQETTDLAEAEGWAPSPNCAGLDRCRCLVVYELAQ